MGISVKRVYEPAAETDGYRVLVDGIWPRGVSKDRAAVAEWRRELAPSKQLRQWFGHDPERWQAFRRAYWSELDATEVDWRPLIDAAAREGLTLVFATRETRYNNAVALRDYLCRRFGLQPG